MSKSKINYNELSNKEKGKAIIGIKPCPVIQRLATVVYEEGIYTEEEKLWLDHLRKPIPHSTKNNIRSTGKRIALYWLLANYPIKQSEVDVDYARIVNALRVIHLKTEEVKAVKEALSIQVGETTELNKIMRTGFYDKVRIAQPVDLVLALIEPWKAIQDFHNAEPVGEEMF